MADDKKFYWLKLKKDFFKRHDIKVIEAMPNGKDYVLFYLKLMVESIGHDGELRFSDTIPYNEDMLSAITNTNIDIVRSAMKLLVSLELVEIFDDFTIYMREVEKLTGSETKWAEKKRLQRGKEDNVPALSPPCPPDVRQEIRDKRLEKRDKRQEINSPTDYEFFQNTYNGVCRALPQCRTMTDKRKRLAREFLKAFGEEQWTEVCKAANQSAFLSGQNDRGWKADIDFLLRTDKAAKILEGFYEKAHQKGGDGFGTGNPFLEMRDEMNEGSDLF